MFCNIPNTILNIVGLKTGTVATAKKPLGKKAYFYKTKEGQVRPLRDRLKEVCGIKAGTPDRILFLAPPILFQKVLFFLDPSHNLSSLRGLPAEVKPLIFDEAKNNIFRSELSGAAIVISERDSMKIGEITKEGTDLYSFSRRATINFLAPSNH
ncbi:hypothetical protein A2291_00225 [candidate division WOR-1 bacterium RIFOXYB2_FULL_42_35]|uniref:Uncharacterized protein n=1 Tax=candidate division WOR-1 bacterium RIFOXYC2_FULL_41_25 TaxID=1802586 RepID=A0A1F4TM82_UNCSA|nr:MAG: hypothetical protein A2247_05745 [candidate division WOR-1 bacterium RIFOXYA2_FULL_41_14]OGC24141.1 MAG: hypothetical protein A2291_00225 [candidate division WOR-1 bacterium RIFOXYB2_FULL_42_35]OGC33828.1 MAG: hypothetical protein A2462_01900 [candidate division WOR-1 bacterium RIFOXYC2_FULL_41_25]